MDFLAFFNHLLNFVAPAFFVAVGLVLACHVFLRKAAKPHGWIAPAAINFAVGVGVLAGCLVVWGRDGRMLTYSALVLACATSQWLCLRSWRA